MPSVRVLLSLFSFFTFFQYIVPAVYAKKVWISKLRFCYCFNFFKKANTYEYESVNLSQNDSEEEVDNDVQWLNGWNKLKQSLTKEDVTNFYRSKNVSTIKAERFEDIINAVTILSNISAYPPEKRKELQMLTEHFLLLTSTSKQNIDLTIFKNKGYENLLKIKQDLITTNTFFLNSNEITNLIPLMLQPNQVSYELIEALLGHYALYFNHLITYQNQNV